MNEGQEHLVYDMSAKYIMDHYVIQCESIWECQALVWARRQRRMYNRFKQVEALLREFGKAK